MGDWLELLKGTVLESDLARIREEKAQGMDLTETLLVEKLVSTRGALSALASHYRHPSIQLEHYNPSKTALSKVTEDIARRFCILPLFQMEDHLFVAIANPEDLPAQDYLGQLTGLVIEPVIATRQAIEAAITRHFLSKEQSAKNVGEMAVRESPKTQESPDLHIEDSDAPVIKLVNYLLAQAVRLGASDLHLAPFRDRVCLRYRVDGILHEFPAPPLEIYKALVSRIKILSNLDIAERRLPQDGRTSIQVDNREYDTRISIIPNMHGEGVVIRILDTRGGGKELGDLGFDPLLLERYKKLIQKPHGILLITGPTGSGKSTTLYGTLKQILNPKRHIITLEDPVEYQLNGVTQIQVNAEIGFTFANGLRSILRHDPDIIMLGEIRDMETAEIAIRSSLTGHLVLSTLHTNDAPSAVVRLIDMGIEPFMLFSSLIGIMAQRLLRRLCPECKVAAPIEDAQWAALGLRAIPDRSVIFRAAGCPSCNHLGYKGRIAIGELLEITPAMRRLSSQDATPDNLRNLACSKEFHLSPTGLMPVAGVPEAFGPSRTFGTLRESALSLLFAGVTTVSEVLGVTETVE